MACVEHFSPHTQTKLLGAFIPAQCRSALITLSCYGSFVRCDITSSGLSGDGLPLHCGCCVVRDSDIIDLPCIMCNWQWGLRVCLCVWQQCSAARLSLQHWAWQTCCPTAVFPLFHLTLMSLIHPIAADPPVPLVILSLLPFDIWFFFLSKFFFVVNPFSNKQHKQQMK